MAGSGGKVKGKAVGRKLFKVYASCLDRASVLTWRVSSIKRRPRSRFAMLLAEHGHDKNMRPKRVYLRRGSGRSGWHFPPERDNFPLSEWPESYSATEAGAWRKAVPLLKKERDEARKALEEGKAEGWSDPEIRELRADLSMATKNYRIACRKVGVTPKK